MIRIRAAVPTDALPIAVIYNQGIAERSSTFETKLSTAQDTLERINAAATFPVLVTRTMSFSAGRASARTARAPATRVSPTFRSTWTSKHAGGGAGKQLLNGLIDAASSLGYWKLLSRVFPFNTASRALCRGCGFREVGVYQKHAKLDGSWLDVVIVERLIPANLT